MTSAGTPYRLVPAHLYPWEAWGGEEGKGKDQAPKYLGLEPPLVTIILKTRNRYAVRLTCRKTS